MRIWRKVGRGEVEFGGERGRGGRETGWRTVNGGRCSGSTGTVGDMRRCLRWTRQGEDRLRNVERSSCGKRGDVRRKMEEEKGGRKKEGKRRGGEIVR